MPYTLIPPGKRGSSWYVRGKDASGKFEFSTGQKSRGRAAAWADAFVAERARRRVPGQGEIVSFTRAAEAYAAARNLSRGDAALIDALAVHFADIVDLRTMTHAHLIDAANALRPAGSDATKNRKVIAPAAAVLHYASEQKWCEYQRLKKFREPRRSSREPASDATLRLLIANAEAPSRTKPTGRKSDRNAAHKRLLLAMLYELGLRITDLLRVDWLAIDLPGARVRVRIAKTDEYASLELSAALVAALASLPEQRGRLFPWSTRRGVYGWLGPLCKRLGVTYTPHLSRHALATAALEAQIPDKRAAELGVWRDTRSLHRYQHARPDAIPGRSAGAVLAGFPRGRGGK